MEFHAPKRSIFFRFLAHLFPLEKVAKAFTCTHIEPTIPSVHGTEPVAQIYKNYI